jgi:hypothetical protein
MGVALATAVLLAPVATAAATIEFSVTDGGELAAEFGDEFRFFGDAEHRPRER